ncbi:MAG: 3',5'-cyclic-nucleotide phosphodiesterase [Algisphaera sp.]
MKFQALAVSDVSPARYQGASSYLINDNLLIDAGTIGLWGTADDQANIKHVLITHAHIDHISTLPLFVENAYTPGPHGPTIHGHPETLDTLHRQLFNGKIWPDFLAMSTPDNTFMTFNPIAPEKTFTLAGLRITPIAVDHDVPTYGYIVQDDHCAIVFGGDSAPTTRLWEVANTLDTPVAAVVMEASFPNNMKWLAEESFHMTPDMFGVEMDKLNTSNNTRFLAVHLKPRHQHTITTELAALNRSNLEVAKMNHVYEVGRG